MTPSTAGLRSALSSLHEALELPRQRGEHPQWRQSVRQRIASLHECLDHRSDPDSEEWQVARSGAILRERNALLGRIAALGSQVQHAAEVETLRQEIRRLVTDVNHHLQRLSDLAYDDVELELGGSE